LQVIGEAARALPDDVRAFAPDDRMAQDHRHMRNVLVHGSFDISGKFRFGEIAGILPGRYVPASDYDPAGGYYVVYGSNSIMGRVCVSRYDGPIIAFARIGSNCGAMLYSSAPSWINNRAASTMRLASIRAKAGCDTRFIYYWMQSCDVAQIDPVRAKIAGR
jgi:hypothetical protein